MRKFPALSGPLKFMRNPRLMLIRIPLAILLIIGGFLAILPFFGLWMIPVGLLLLAVDVPRLQGPVSALIIRARRRIDNWRHRARR